MAAPAEPAPPRGRLAAVQEGLALVGLVSGIAISTISAWAIISRWRAAARARRAQQK